MENTTNGANVSTAEKPATAASSPTSPKVVKTNTKRTKEPITRAEAAELLTSALSYCQESGLEVVGYNEGTTLILSIEGLEYRNDRIQPVTLISNDNVTESNVNSVEK